jgi:mono/diheme cytochrome c family protein
VLAQSGAETFDMKCASCHGKDGAGKTSFAQKATLPDLRSQAVQSKSDRDLHDSIGRGVGHKAYPHAYLMRGMTEGQLNSVIGFVRSLKN